VVPGYFARITDRARTAGNLAAGYNEIYLTLAAMAVVCAVVVMMLGPPRAAAKE